MSEKEEKQRGLEWRDYIAIVIATLQTTLLPFVVFVLVLILVLFLLG